jgi:phosphate acetyltransferase
MNESSLSAGHLQALMDQAAPLQPIRCAIVHPCETVALQGALDAAAQGMIIPVLVGPLARIQEIAASAGISLKGVELAEAAHSHAAAELAVQLAVEGHVEALMKGSLHTDELMHAAVMHLGFRTKRRLSHVFRFEVPLYDKPLLITDAGLNIRPTLAEKVDIVQNAIDLARILGINQPKVAILAAIETVNPSMPSTIEAAALCKMADRGQITNALLDGPLAFDCAISDEAARIKGIESTVAGYADILVVPDLEAGNMLAKQLEYLAGATSSGVVVGGRVPIALTSRSDGSASRITSALLTKLIAHHNRIIRP